MPSGNIVPSPGFVDSTQQKDSYVPSGVVSIPLDKSVGILDEQYDCHLANPHAERDTPSSTPHNQLQHSCEEALLMQPFLQLDVALSRLLSAGEEVGNALLDEQEASANGERVIAAEHVQDGAPAASVEKCPPCSFLPSPPESSSSRTSPLRPGLFDFGDATNLCASGSNHDAFGSLGLSDSISNAETASSAWSLSSFGDFGGHDSYAYGSTDADASASTLQLSVNTEESRRKGDSGYAFGYLSNVPPSPVSIGPWKSGAFELGQIMMADFSSLDASASSNDPQTQKEDAWLSAYFNEHGSEPV